MIGVTREEQDREAGDGGSAASAIQWEANGGASLPRNSARRSRSWTRGCDAGVRSWGRVNRSSPRSTTSLDRACSIGRAGRRLRRMPGGGRSIPGGSGSCCRRSGGLVAIAGFRVHRTIRHRARPSGMSHRDEVTGAAVAWGPVCAEPALRAWGEQVAGRLLQEQTQAREPEPASGSRAHASEGDKGVAINRLTRRLRISDPPHHFQTVATTVLRTSLNLTAVAWVPRDPHEPVVVSGEIPGLSAQGVSRVSLAGGA